MNIRKALFVLVCVVFVLALCTSGTATAGQELSLTFQEKFNMYTGELDLVDGVTGTMDIGLRRWNITYDDPPSLIGSRGQMRIRQFYTTGANGDETTGDAIHYPAALVYFPDVASIINALPDEAPGEPGHGINAGVGPYINSATLTLIGAPWSANTNRDEEIINPVPCEVSMLTPHATMWSEDETPIAVGDRTRPRTNATYRDYDAITPGNSVAWAATHLYAMRDGDPGSYTAPAVPNVAPGDQQATCADHAASYVTYVGNGNPWTGLETMEFDVLDIVTDWVEGTYENQGFHVDMGREDWDGDLNMNLHIITKEGADGTWSEASDGPPRELLTDAPKLVIKYSYNGFITADAGADMGNYQVDAVKRVKEGTAVTLDGSASTPVFAASPITQYKWTWNYGTNEYTVISPNDQTTAQFFPMEATTDSVTLVASDDIGQTGTDGAKIKVTERIPGDLNDSGAVNLTDFVILRNDF